MASQKRPREGILADVQVGQHLRLETGRIVRVTSRTPTTVNDEWLLDGRHVHGGRGPRVERIATSQEYADQSAALRRSVEERARKEAERDAAWERYIDEMRAAADDRERFVAMLRKAINGSWYDD